MGSTQPVDSFVEAQLGKNAGTLTAPAKIVPSSAPVFFESVCGSPVSTRSIPKSKSRSTLVSPTLTTSLARPTLVEELIGSRPTKAIDSSNS